jgi:hypothetical protein
MSGSLPLTDPSKILDQLGCKDTLYACVVCQLDVQCDGSDLMETGAGYLGARPR